MTSKSFITVFMILLGSTYGNVVKEKEPDWWESTIFYQIYPRSFMDSNGDGIGDINGITSKLEYLKELGVGATWLCPIFKSPMYDFGYDISDFYAIEEEYGTMEDFDKLLKTAKKLDIKIILDFVPNHTSNESMWFKEALKGHEKYYKYYLWEDGSVDETGKRLPPNNWVSVFRKSAWEYRPEVGKYYLHQFVIGQPDLDYRNPDVIEEMKNIIHFWLEKGVAGFRIGDISHLFEVDKNNFGGRYPDEPLSGNLNVGPDDYGYLNHIYTKNQNECYDMVYQWRKIFDEISKQDGLTRVMMTEAYTDIKDTIRYYRDGERDGAHIPFNYAFIADLNKNSTAADIKYAVDRWSTYAPLEIPNWVVGNHDYSRVATRYGPELVDGINMLDLLLPGIAVTYMGDELGMEDGYVSWEATVDPSGCNTDDPINYWKASRDPNRTPFHWSAEKNAGFSTADKTWLPVASGFENLNVEVQSTNPKSHLNIYRTLAALRQKRTFRFGRYDSLALNADVFAFRRWHHEEIYVVLVNMRDTDHTVDLTYLENVKGNLTVVISSEKSPKEAGDIVEAHNIKINGKEAFVLKLL